MRNYNDEDFNNKIINNGWRKFSSILGSLLSIYFNFLKICFGVLIGIVFVFFSWLIPLIIGSVIGYVFYLLCNFIGLTNVILTTSTGYGITLSMIIGGVIGFIAFLRVVFSNRK
jgi:small-conductance mechanosensitive channel